LLFVLETAPAGFRRLLPPKKKFFLAKKLFWSYLMFRCRFSFPFLKQNFFKARELMPAAAV
jgi:hypothetical protein